MPDEMTGWRVHVDAGMCEGHALCIELAPEVFDLADDEVARAVPTPPARQWDNVKAAIDACPRQAISYSTLPTKGH